MLEEDIHNEVDGEGWQNPWVFNGRYAIILIGGGYQANSNDPFYNNPAFWNGGIEFYNKLIDYNYNDENIYLTYQDYYGENGEVVGNQHEDERIDCIAAWDVPDEDDTLDVITEIGDKITKRDFFLFYAAAQSNRDYTYVAGKYLIDKEGKKIDSVAYEKITYENISHAINIELGGGYYENPKQYARMCVVFDTCFSGRAHPWLSGEQRIISSSCGSSEMGDVSDDHLALAQK